MVFLLQRVRLRYYLCLNELNQMAFLSKQARYLGVRGNEEAGTVTKTARSIVDSIIVAQLGSMEFQMSNGTSVVLPLFQESSSCVPNLSNTVIRTILLSCSVYNYYTLQAEDWLTSIKPSICND